ncbi:MAG TPA: hypothetical protein VF843_09805 [Streptosporangiaceae bacterium]
MSSTIIWNLVLTVPFLLAFIGIPLWMTIRHLDRAADHTAARRYLAVKGTPVVTTARHQEPQPQATASELVLAGRS